MKQTSEDKEQDIIKAAEKWLKNKYTVELMPSTYVDYVVEDFISIVKSEASRNYHFPIIDTEELNSKFVKWYCDYEATNSVPPKFKMIVEWFINNYNPTSGITEKELASLGVLTGESARKFEEAMENSPQLSKDELQRIRQSYDRLNSIMKKSDIKKETTDWINVMDEYPEYYKQVLCLNKEGKHAVCWRASDGDNTIYTISHTDNIFNDVVKWKHLPNS